MHANPVGGDVVIAGLLVHDPDGFSDLTAVVVVEIGEGKEIIHECHSLEVD